MLRTDFDMIELDFDTNKRSRHENDSHVSVYCDDSIGKYND